jgi:hypothetical protein
MDNRPFESRKLKFLESNKETPTTSPTVAGIRSEITQYMHQKREKKTNHGWS